MTSYVLAIVTALAVLARGCEGALSAHSSVVTKPRLWQILENRQPAQAWRTIFGDKGERGEYMDGYAEQAMLKRCREDYGYAAKFSPPDFPSERALMMSHLYDNAELYKSVCMVCFAEHYLLGISDADIAQPFNTFQRHQKLRPAETPIFAGVVFSGWQDEASAGPQKATEQKLVALKERGVDYIRLECNLGSADEIGTPEQLVHNPTCSARLRRLAEVAQACQRQELVPLILLQLPWREPGRESSKYFKQVRANHARPS